MTFEIGTDLNVAQILVQNRVSTRAAVAAAGGAGAGRQRQKKSTSILQIVALTSPDSALRQPLPRELRDASVCKDELARLPGVGSVDVFGAGQYAMRVWLDPEKLQGARPHRART